MSEDGVARLRDALRAGLRASWRWDDLTDDALREKVLDDMEPAVRAALSGVPEGADPARDAEDYEGHEGHEAYIKGGLCSHPIHDAYLARLRVPEGAASEGLTAASEQLIRDFDQHPDALDGNELSARLWLIERQGRALRPVPSPEPLDVERLRAKLLYMANRAAESRPLSDVQRGYERACDELLEWLAAPQPVPEDER